MLKSIILLYIISASTLLFGMEDLSKPNLQKQEISYFGNIPDEIITNHIIPPYFEMRGDTIHRSLAIKYRYGSAQTPYCCSQHLKKRIYSLRRLKRLDKRFYRLVKEYCAKEVKFILEDVLRIEKKIEKEDKYEFIWWDTSSLIKEYLLNGGDPNIKLITQHGKIRLLSYALISASRYCNEEYLTHNCKHEGKRAKNCHLCENLQNCEHMQNVDRLLERGVDVNYVEENIEQQTPLMLLVDYHWIFKKFNKFSLIRQLITRGVAINARDKMGRTVLHFAAKKADSTLITTLFGYKPQIIADHSGHTPQDKARAVGWRKISNGQLITQKNIDALITYEKMQSVVSPYIKLIKPAHQKLAHILTNNCKKASSDQS